MSTDDGIKFESVTSGTSEIVDVSVYDATRINCEYWDRNITDTGWQVMPMDDPDDGPSIGNSTLFKADADYYVTVYLPADDIDANVARLVALLNEHWPITEDAATWFERTHQDVIAADELHDTIKADIGQEGE